MKFTSIKCCVCSKIEGGKNGKVFQVHLMTNLCILIVMRSHPWIMQVGQMCIIESLTSFFGFGVDNLTFLL